jgi:hypothetical protein
VEFDCRLRATSAWILSDRSFAQVEVLFNGFTALMVQWSV